MEEKLVFLYSFSSEFVAVYLKEKIECLFFYSFSYEFKAVEKYYRFSSKNFIKFSSGLVFFLDLLFICEVQSFIF